MNDDEILELLEKVKNNKIDEQTALSFIKKSQYEDLNFAKVDHSRKNRNGYPEVIYCEGKTVSQISSIISSIEQSGNNVFGTRLSIEKYEELRKIHNNLYYNELARTVSIKNNEIKMSNNSVAIITAGTSDIPVSEEAFETLQMLGITSKRFYDVGVAGIHRLFDNLEEIRKSKVIITVAGMEGALASVVGGLVKVPVVAVPTSVGYGASFNGLSSLLTMLNSCASGVSTMNIDNGFGAGYFAGSIINLLEDKDRGEDEENFILWYIIWN